jgi:hypothetical protein
MIFLSSNIQPQAHNFNLIPEKVYGVAWLKTISFQAYAKTLEYKINNKPNGFSFERNLYVFRVRWCGFSIIYVHITGLHVWHN